MCACVCIYKMVDIGKETYENNDIEVIVDGIDTLWLNEKHIVEKKVIEIYQLSQANMIQYTKSKYMN